MNELLQKIRLIPIVLVAAGGLLTLKVAGIALDGGYTLGAGHQAIADRAARDAALSRLATRPVPVVRADEEGFSAHDDVTGWVPSKPKPPAAEATAPVEARPVSPVQLARSPPVLRRVSPWLLLPPPPAPSTVADAAALSWDDVVSSNAPRL